MGVVEGFHISIGMLRILYRGSGPPVCVACFPSCSTRAMDAFLTHRETPALLLLVVCQAEDA